MCYSLRGWRSEDQGASMVRLLVKAVSLAYKELSPGLQQAICLLKGAPPSGSHLNLNYLLPKGPIFKYHHTGEQDFNT